MAQAIGLIFGGISAVANTFKIMDFAEQNLPPAEGASVRIKMGNPGDDDPGVGGEISAVHAWDVNNNYLGRADGQNTDGAGDTADFVVDQSSGGARADFIAISAGNDAICIAWVTVTQKDGSEGGAWTGDIGAGCDQPTHFNNEKAGTDPDTGEDYKPMCTWVDKDKTGGDEPGTFKFKVDAYGPRVNETMENGAQCSMTIFGDDSAPINAAPGEKRSKLSARSKMGKRPPKIADNLIITKDKSQTAKRLCDMENSWGSDVVGPDGYYCDMDTKTLYPLCSTKNVEGCVDLDELEGANRMMKRSFVPNSDGFKRAEHSTHRQFAKVTHWD